MKSIYMIITLVIISLSPLKAEHFFDFYFHKIDLDNFPTVKVIGLVDMVQSGNEFHELLNDPNLPLFENDRPVGDVFFDYIEVRGTKVIFEISYVSDLPLEYDRTVRIDNFSRDRRYTFLKSGDLHIEPDVYEEAPKGFIPVASLILTEHFNNSSSVERYVLAREGLNIKQLPNKDSETVGHIPHGKKIKVSKRREDVKRYDGELFQESLYGYWRAVTDDGIDGYILDTYLSYLPARMDQDDDLISFLDKSFDPPKDYGFDKLDNELAIYQPFVVLNKTPDDNNGYIYFNGLTQQEFYIVAQNWFYDQKRSQVKIEKDRYWDGCISLVDPFDYIEYDISNRQFYRDRTSVYIEELYHGVRCYKNSKELKKIIDQVPVCKMIKTNTTTAKLGEIYKDSTIVIPNSIWNRLMPDRTNRGIFNESNKVELIAKSPFLDYWLLLFRTTGADRSQEWLVTIRNEYEQPGELYLADAIPVKNDTISSASFHSIDGRVYLNHYSDSHQVWNRDYSFLNGGYVRKLH